ncbi:MAG: glycoside hydrolase family 16 protein [Colwellia sp.]|nr:glycoside hydrolase family 16 protein [Colwellia sp.]
MYQDNALKTLFILLALSTSSCGTDGTNKEVNTPTDNTANVTATETSVETTQDPTEISVVNDQWQLIWQDEFSGDEIDSSKWNFEVNCFGGGNNEQQCYTDRVDNAYVEQGTLKIVAQREDFTGPAVQDDDPSYNPANTRTQPYTSARLRTKHEGDWTYGRFEISAKLPYGQGTWPAIWMLPTDWVYGGWAGSGELDIMEVVNLKTQSDEDGATEGQEESRIIGSLHYGRNWPENIYSNNSFHLPDGTSPADGFHEYAIEWQEGEIRWYVDDIHYATQRDSGWYTQYLNDDGVLMNGAGSAPFDQAFHLILNFAVGGAWAGNVNEKGIDESVFPQTMEVDYVRVYECSVSPITGAGCETIGEEATLIEGHQAPEL